MAIAEQDMRGRVEGVTNPGEWTVDARTAQLCQRVVHCMGNFRERYAGIEEMKELPDSNVRLVLCGDIEKAESLTKFAVGMDGQLMQVLSDADRRTEVIVKAINSLIGEQIAAERAEATRSVVTSVVEKYNDPRHD